MTTGMKQDQTTDTYPKRKPNWLLPAVAVALAVALLAWMFSPKDEQTAPSSTGSSVQQGATGQQGSVGSFSNTVVPSDTGQNTNTPDYQTVPEGSHPGTHAGKDAGSGVSGITTSTDSLGGAGRPNAENPLPAR